MLLNGLADFFTSCGLECHHGFPEDFGCFLAFLFCIFHNVAENGFRDLVRNRNFQLEAELFQKLRQCPILLEILQKTLPLFTTFGDDLAKVGQVLERWTLGFFRFDQWRNVVWVVDADYPKCSEQTEDWWRWLGFGGFWAGNFWRCFSASNIPTFAVIASDVATTVSLSRKKKHIVSLESLAISYTKHCLDSSE